MVSVGICEDDAELRSVLSRALGREEFSVSAVRTGHEAVERWRETPPDIMIIDIGLPDADGRDVCQALRAHGIAAPVLFLTARDTLTDRLSGFHVGGDDYLTKPFALAELVVRLRALARRSPDPGGPENPDALDFVLDPATHALARGEVHIALTPTEFRILATLAAAPGAVVRRRELVAAAWPQGGIVHDNTLDAYIARLRRKLREAGALSAIETRRGLGYMLA